MSGNILWGLAFITFGASIILNKLYNIAVPFEVILGAFFIILGISKLLDQPRRHS